MGAQGRYKIVRLGDGQLYLRYKIGNKYPWYYGFRLLPQPKPVARMALWYWL